MDKSICEHCGYDEELHHSGTQQCPAGGEAMVDKKQEWLEQKFEQKASCCFCKGIKGALIKLYQGWCCVPCFKETILKEGG